MAEQGRIFIEGDQTEANLAIQQYLLHNISIQKQQEANVADVQEENLPDDNERLEDDGVAAALHETLEFDKELFIEEVRKYNCLWDTNSKYFKDRTMKKNAWTKIGQIFHKEGKLIQQSEHVHLF